MQTCDNEVKQAKSWQVQTFPERYYFSSSLTNNKKVLFHASLVKQENAPPLVFLLVGLNVKPFYTFSIQGYILLTVAENVCVTVIASWTRGFSFDQRKLGVISIQ